MIGDEHDSALLQHDTLRVQHYAAAYFTQKQVLEYLKAPLAWAQGDIAEDLQLEKVAPQN